MKGKRGSPTQLELNQKLKDKVAKLEEEVKTLRRKLKSSEFWSKFVYPEGAKATDIQNELMDYHEMLGEVDKVYDHITCGRISKPNTKASSVIAVANEVAQRDIQNAIEDHHEVYSE
jgi:hypothetical protein